VVLTAQQRYVLAERQAREAESLAESCSANLALAQALMSREVACQLLGNSAGGALARRALELYESAGDLTQQATVQANLGVIDFYDGRWGHAIEAYRSASQAFARLGNPVQQAMSQANLGEVLVLQGRDDEARTVLENAHRVLVATEYGEGVHFTAGLLARLDLGTPRQETMLEEMATLHTTLLESGDQEIALGVTIPLAEGRRLAGSPEVALQILERTEAAAPAHLSVFGPALATVRAHCLLDLGQAADAAAVANEGRQAALAAGLGFEEARLTLLEATAREALGQRVDAHAVAAAVEELERLGVIEPWRGIKSSSASLNS
jgi:tetratricopeptide (TPR) repeat protein